MVLGGLGYQTTGRHTTRQHLSSEVVVWYRFHPFAGERLAVVRVHQVHDEPCYVVRRLDGTTVSIPAWMTELAAGEMQFTREPCLPLSVLVALRRVVSTFLSLSACPGHMGERDAITPDNSESSIRRDGISAPSATAAGYSGTAVSAHGAVVPNRGREDQRGGAR